jgi:hypothetical protein
VYCYVIMRTYCVLWSVNYLCTAMKCTILWKRGWELYTMDLVFFCFCRLLSETRFGYTRHCYLISVTRFLSMRRCYLISVTRFLNTRRCYLISVTCFLNTRRCYLISVTRFLNTRHWYLHISDAFLRVTNLSTSQTQQKWRVFFVSLITLWMRH